MEVNITKDPAYNAVDPSDFPAMLNPARYGERSTAFDKIISATHDHFWDPLDKKYIDFSAPFDMENEYLVNPSANADHTFAPPSATSSTRPARSSSSISPSAGRCPRSCTASRARSRCPRRSATSCAIRVRRNTPPIKPGKEARHVTAFSAYVKARWGKPRTVGPALGNLLNELVSSPLVWKKLVGMQLLVEGLAMGAFATFYKRSRDPLMKHLMQMVMTDEAFHHKFGKIWADRTIPKLSKEEHNLIEDWAWDVFQVLLYNLGSPDQKAWVYEACGLDPMWCQQAFMEALTDAGIREELQETTNIFRVLINTLLKAGIITDRTREVYAAYIDMAELHAEGDRMIGDDIAEEGIKLHLMQLNGGQLLRTPSMLAAE